VVVVVVVVNRVISHESRLTISESLHHHHVRTLAGEWQRDGRVVKLQLPASRLYKVSGFVMIIIDFQSLDTSGVTYTHTHTHTPMLKNLP
jgi:hypothetical protein